MNDFRLLSWNIRHGGGARSESSAVRHWSRRHEPRRAPSPSHRWLEVGIPRHKLTVAAFYGPLEDVPYADWWTSVREVMADRVNTPVVLAGDFNTGLSVVDGPRDPFYCAEQFRAVQELGMTDVWRRENPAIREYSWYSRRAGRDLNGFRLDHVLASPGLAGRLRGVRHSHAEREASISDHSILLADFGRSKRRVGKARRRRVESACR